MNVGASDQHKKYDDSVPSFLHNRPKTVVQHCMHRWIDSENSTLDDIDQVSSLQFLVKSFNEVNKTLCYEVFLENESGMPSCQCMDWMNKHLPCKLLMTGFRQFPNSWNLIPVIYRDNPYICLDVESFPLDSAEDTSGFDDDNISEVHISSIEGEEYRIESLPIPPRQRIKH
ncbi:unnamed protein product [Mytilus edulis]|uniref:SWIM-type domain-containing protein n=1 Tax=Mytilus edulis TaxID=6550 RepID=A0A8S3Q6U7_MYTED|nr:unnamed protein product [Mytilus edulis]